MTLDKAKSRLEDYIIRMEKDENISYAAILKDPIYKDNYWFEYGTPFDDFFSNYHIEKSVNSRELDIIRKKGSLVYFSNVDQEYIKLKNTTKYGRLLNNKNLTTNCHSPILDQVRPLKAGIGVSDYKSEAKTGTIGGFFKAKKNKNTYLISNMHVLARYDNGTDKRHPVKHNEKIVQPSTSNANLLRLTSKKNAIGETVWKMFDSEVDVAIAKVYSNINIQKGFFNLRDQLIDDNIRKVDKYFLNKDCFKIGYRTGHTSAKLVSIDSAIKVENHFRNINGGKEYIFFRIQLMTDDMAKQGWTML